MGIFTAENSPAEQILPHVSLGTDIDYMDFTPHSKFLEVGSISFKPPYKQSSLRLRDNGISCMWGALVLPEKEGAGTKNTKLLQTLISVIIFPA